MHALRALLASLFDYAGLFPPAALDLPAAVQSYDDARRGPDAWAMGRLVVPAARLADLAALLPAGAAWQISALADPFAPADLADLAAFNAAAWPAQVDTVEIKAADAAAIPAAVRAIPAGLAVYIELPLDPDPAPLVAAVAAAGARAKLRAGGLVAAAIPAPEAILAFLVACHRHGLPWKATAGLHHPVRAPQRLTYAADSPVATMHGFLNVFLAAAALDQGHGPTAALDLLTATDSPATAPDGALAWRGHRFTADDLRATRGLAHAIGSCSFTEPLHDLKEMTLL